MIQYKLLKNFSTPTTFVRAGTLSDERLFHDTYHVFKNELDDSGMEDLFFASTYMNEHPDFFEKIENQN